MTVIQDTNEQIINQTTDKGEVLIKVENVSKKLCKDLKKSLWYGVQDISRETLGLKRKTELRPREFWAIDDVSFELRRGECLGLMGVNGAGKSTLLKMLNGLIKPDKGRITLKGRVGALIELGAGFNPILSGRENVYINGAVLGFTREEITAKFEDILAFSEIGDFIDSPVQNYSSGMKIRLGFAIASHMEPDIMLIDEVLAVGDIGFRAKCLKKIKEMIQRCCVIFVSHTAKYSKEICNEILVLNKGRNILHTQDIKKGIKKYNSLTPTVLKEMKTLPPKKETRKVDGEKFIEIINCKLLEVGNEKAINNFGQFAQLDLIINFKFTKHYLWCAVAFTITNDENDILLTSKSDLFKLEETPKQNFTFKVRFQNMFKANKYYLNIFFIGKTEIQVKYGGRSRLSYKRILDFTTYGKKNFLQCPIQFHSEWENITQYI